MKYDEVLSGLILLAVRNSRVRSHDRVVLTRYTPAQAEKIVSQLLIGGVTTCVRIYRDNGEPFTLDMPAVNIETADTTVELIPYVVTPHRDPGSPLWFGSQSFAGKLRSCFTKGVSAGVTRLLLVFDEHPVETEHSTAETSLANAMESVSSLRTWVASEEWDPAMPQEIKNSVMAIINAWEKARTDGPLPWRRTHVDELESLATFADECRHAATVADIGRLMPRLGLLFADPDLATEAISRWPKRVEENFALAHELEEIRTDRVFDPLTDVERVLNLGIAGEAFYDAMATAISAPTVSVTNASVTFGEVRAHRRTSEKTLAWLDITGMRFTALNEVGEPTGGELQWRLLAEPTLPPDGGDPAEVVVATTAKRIRLSVPIRGAIPSVLYLNGQHHLLPEFPDGKLTPDNQLSFDLDAPEEMGIRTLAVRPKKPGLGRLARPYQEVHIAIVTGAAAPVPQGARLDAATHAYLVDDTAHEIPVQMGGRVVTISGEELPPEDGSIGVLEIDGVRVRWKGEDRGSSGDPMAGSRRVRLRELLGVRQLGTPSATQAYFTATNELGVVSQTAAIVDVSENDLAEEALLIKEPERFAGTCAMSETARAELMQVVPQYFDRWLTARRSFFAAAAEASERTLPGAGGDRPSMYLVDLREPEVASVAERYVESYCDLLAEIITRAAGAANAALIEPVLLCDRVIQQEDAVSLAPTHPVAVSFLATIQRAFFSREWPSATDREALESLLSQSLLAGGLPWLPWRGEVLTAARTAPLLWRQYGKDGGTVDTSDDLGPIIVDKVRNLLELAPHLRRSNQRLFLNIEIGHGAGEYLSRAVRELINDNSIECAFDIGIVRSPSAPTPSLLEAFSGGSRSARGGDTDQFRRAVRVAEIPSVSSREAHLVFRLEAAEAEKNSFTTISKDIPLLRSTGFAAGLAEEPARFATLRESEVIYTRYVNSMHDGGELPPPQGSEELWDGPWRRRFAAVTAVSRKAVIGLRNAIAVDMIACQRLRQNADTATKADYDKSFVTVHCDPTQGPEFFVGTRAAKSNVFLVECTDRGSPQLPGRDIVTVTSRIAPFRAALAAAVRQLPPPLRAIVNDDVAKGLLRDINLLRGTEVFAFLRKSSRESSHIGILDGLDNILAMRLLLERQLRVADHFPVVVSLRDLASRSGFFKRLRIGTQCDDIVVFYLPKPADGSARLLYRITEVKFGQRRELKRKALQQLAETARKFADVLPSDLWRAEESVVPILMEKDVAWVLHEAIERYRSFGLIADDVKFEQRWHVRQLFTKLHAGDFSLKPLQPSDGTIVNGTALLFDPEIPGDVIETEYDSVTEVITVPVEVIKQLLTRDAQASASWDDGQIVHGSDAPGNSESVRAETYLRADAAEAPCSEAQQGDGYERQTFSPVNDAGSNEVEAPVCRPQEETTDNNEDATGFRRVDLSADLAAKVRHIDELFDGFIGNEGPVSKLKRSLAIALSEGRRTLEPLALFGPKSTGKTELARRVARALNVPRIELSETTFRSADDLANKIIETAAAGGDRMPNVRREAGEIVRKAPPMIVFIDEVHQLKVRAKECLLTATEPDDRKLLSTQGTIDTRDVTFVIATTDPGELSDPLKSRVYRLDLKEYGIEEIVSILRAHQAHHDDFPAGARLFDDECLKIIARAGRLIPRQALRLFREAARDAQVGFLVPTVEALRRHYLEQDGIDSDGLTNRDRQYLRLLFPDLVLGVESLCAHLGERTTTVTQDVEPYLLRLKLVERARTGRKLTARGRALAAAYGGRQG